MRAGVLIAGLLLAGCQAADQPEAENGVSANGITLVSDRITLPEETAALPAGHDRVTANCTACHSTEMLTNQPKLDVAKWQATIDKMRNVYKAPIDPAHDEALIAELTTLPAQAGR